MARLGLALLSLVIAMPAMPAPDVPVPAQDPASEPEAPRASRLKFKSRRPICLCGNGLSEKDIEQAMRSRADRPTEPHPTRSEK